MHAPQFIIKKGEAEGQSFENHVANVYEVKKNDKVGSLIDEFGFFDNDKFYYVNHHGSSEELDPQELNIDYKGNFQIADNSIYPLILDFSFIGNLL